MSIEASCSVWDNSEVTDPVDVLLLLAMADQVGDELGHCYPPVEFLAKQTRLSIEQVIERINRLGKIGILEIIKRGSPDYTAMYRIVGVGGNR